MYWAKQDAFAEYEKVKKGTIDHYIEETIFEAGDWDYAMVLYHLYKDANLYYTVGAKDIEGKPIKKFNANSFLARYKGTKLESAALAFIKREKGEALTPTEAIIYNKGQEIVKNYDGATSDIRVKQLQKQFPL